MSLKEELKGLSSFKRKYLLFRVSGIEAEPARVFCHVAKGTYNSWLANDENFLTLHRRIDEFHSDYRQEAIKLLRRDNQMDAVILESKIIAKMKEEIETGELKLVKTQLAKEVYSKLMADLDAQVAVTGVTWFDKVALINQNIQERVVEGEVIEIGAGNDTDSTG